MTYTVEVRVDSYSGDTVTEVFTPHAFLVVTGADGVEHSYGFAPTETGFFGEGDVSDNAGHPYDASSGQFQITEAQYTGLMDYITRTDANPPPYALPYGSQCSTWLLAGLAEAGIIPSILGPSMEPNNILVDFIQTLIFNPIWEKIGFEINDLFTSARSWIRRDPLALDLDGDGIETVGASGDATVLFDHDGDGDKSGTGWVKPDDGFLVLDRNGNGLIDSGAELFGVDTVLSDGSKATDGFAALRDLDGNGDNVFDANDAQFTHVRIWRDLDQDGVSDAGELASLADTGIASINLNPTIRTRNYGNGNVQNAESTYTRTDGGTRIIGALDLADNPFFRTFADPIPLTPTAQTLPEMRGAGAVRDLREAASVSGDLATAVANYANLATRDAQVAQLGGIVNAWADTSGMQTSIEQAEAQGYILLYLIPGMNASNYDPYLTYWYEPSDSEYAVTNPYDYAAMEALRLQQATLTQMIGTLERFNGVPFVTVEPEGVETGAGNGHDNRVDRVPGATACAAQPGRRSRRRHISGSTLIRRASLSISTIIKVASESRISSAAA